MLIQTIPVLPSVNLDVTLDFYQKLGFSQLSRYPNYLILARDGQEIHFFLHEPHHHADHSDFACYIRTKGLDALHAEFSKAGLDVSPPANYPWGMRELNVIDPDGSLLRFGEPAAD
jgi:catechol 2,3-dioxygenase-like lactoylglutathione lyase family enzyme